MSTRILQATVNESPDSTEGGIAVASPTNVGFSSTTATASGGTNSQLKSWRVTTFPGTPGFTPQTLTLKVSWSRSGTTSDGFLDTGNEFRLDYSLDNGSNWTTIRLDDDFTALVSNNEVISLTPTTDITKIQVRSGLSAVKVGATSCSVNATVSGVQLEAVINDVQLIVMM